MLISIQEIYQRNLNLSLVSDSTGAKVLGFFLHRLRFFAVAENAADHIENCIKNERDADKHPQNSRGAEGICNDCDAAQNGDGSADRHPKPLSAFHADDIHRPLNFGDAGDQKPNTV